MGLVGAVAPLASQAFGARQPRMVRRALRVGLWAALIAGVPFTAIQLWGEDILLALGQTPEASALAGRYLAGLGWCLIPAWAFMALRNFMSAVNRPEPALWITLAAIPANGVLAYALIYGAFGLPELDLLGAGLATTLVNVGMCLAAVWVCYARHPFKKYRVLGRFWRPDWSLFGKLLQVGLPMSGSFLLEFGAFAAAALVMGNIGTTALAAHQIALQTAAVMFMVPFGISLAATVRVGQAVGRRDAEATRRAGMVAIGLGVVFMAGATALVALTRHHIPLLFLGSDSTAAAETVALGGAAVAARHELLHRRRRADGCGRRAARPQRHHHPADLRRRQLLADRLCRLLVAGVPDGLGRGRRLDRAFCRPRRLCRAVGVAVPSADDARLPARDAGGSLIRRAQPHSTFRNSPCVAARLIRVPGLPATCLLHSEFRIL